MTTRSDNSTRTTATASTFFTVATALTTAAFAITTIIVVRRSSRSKKRDDSDTYVKRSIVKKSSSCCSSTSTTTSAATIPSSSPSPSSPLFSPPSKSSLEWPVENNVQRQHAVHLPFDGYDVDECVTQAIAARTTTRSNAFAIVSTGAIHPKPNETVITSGTGPHNPSVEDDDVAESTSATTRTASADDMQDHVQSTTLHKATNKKNTINWITDNDRMMTTIMQRFVASSSVSLSRDDMMLVECSIFFMFLVIGNLLLPVMHPSSAWQLEHITWDTLVV